MGGIPEIVENGVTGFLVEEQSAAALASAIADLVRRSDRLLRVADNARVRAESEYSLERWQHEMTDCIAASLEASSRSRRRSSYGWGGDGAVARAGWFEPTDSSAGRVRNAAAATAAIQGRGCEQGRVAKSRDHRSAA